MHVFFLPGGDRLERAVFPGIRHAVYRGVAGLQAHDIHSLCQHLPLHKVIEVLLIIQNFQPQMFLFIINSRRSPAVFICLQIVIIAHLLITRRR